MVFMLTQITYTLLMARSQTVIAWAMQSTIIPTMLLSNPAPASIRETLLSTWQRSSRLALNIESRPAN